MWLLGEILLRDLAGSLAQVANHSAGFGSSHPLTGLAI